MKVLLIEDERNLALTLARMVFRVLGRTELRYAESAHEAIDHLKTSALDGQFNLVISDYNLLAGQHGGEVLEWIREHMPHLEARFLFLTGNDRDAARYGVRLLVKPVDTAVLKSTLSEMLNI